MDNQTRVGLDALLTVANEHTEMLTALGERVAELEEWRADVRSREDARVHAFGTLNARLDALVADDVEAAMARDLAAIAAHVRAADVAGAGARRTYETPRVVEDRPLVAPEPGASGPNGGGPAGAGGNVTMPGAYGPDPEGVARMVAQGATDNGDGSATFDLPRRGRDAGLVAVRLARPAWDGLLTMLDDHAAMLQRQMEHGATHRAAVRALDEDRADVLRTRGLLARALRGA